MYFQMSPKLPRANQIPRNASNGHQNAFQMLPNSKESGTQKCLRAAVKPLTPWYASRDSISLGSLQMVGEGREEP